MNNYEVKHILYLLNSILNKGLPLFHNLRWFLSINTKVGKVGQKKQHGDLPPGKYEDDEKGKTLIIAELLHA